MSFKLAQPPSGKSVPRMVEKPLATATLTQGALMLENGSAQFAECGADPVSIGAVAATPAGTDASGFNILGKKEFPAGFMQGIVLDAQIVFRAKYVGGLPAADGGVYGVVKDADNDWKVDFTDTTATRVRLVGRLTNSPENLPEVLVRFIAANLQPL